MLRDCSSSAIVAVKDLDRARAFYEGTLGLKAAPGSDDQILIFHTGATKLVVYVSAYAGTNLANAAVWGVGEEIEAIAADLAAKGVVFERYDLPGATFSDGVHATGGFRMVWFKDPDGSILHLNSGT